MWEFLSKLDVYEILGLVVALGYLVVTLRLIIYQLSQFNKLGELRVLLFVACLSLIQMLATSIYPENIPDLYSLLLEVSNSVYTLVELVALLFIFYHIIQNTQIKKAIRFLVLMSILLLVVFSFDLYKTLDRHFGLLTLLCGLCMLVLSLFGYYEIIISDYKKDIKTSYQFWLITAVAFFYSISLPLYFFNDFIRNKPNSQIAIKVLTILGTTYYTLFFMLLKKASKCKVIFPK